MPRCITLPYVVKIGQFVAEMFSFSIFQPSAILDLKNPSTLLADMACGAEMHISTKLLQNWSFHCDVAIFHFFKMAAVRHLGFVWGTFGPPTESTL